MEGLRPAMTEHYPNAMDAQLELLRASLAQHTYPGYPQRSQRFSCSPEEAALIAAGQLNIPHGPWTLGDKQLPEAWQQNELLQRGLRLDSSGRPLHPWFESMVTDRTIGVVSGKGVYWHWGPNHTADNIVICEDSVLLIKRGDTGLWALPGGHVDPGETAFAAALRELTEETALRLDAAVPSTVVYTGPVTDLRATAHAWPETTAYLRVIDGPVPPIRSDGDETRDVQWLPISSIDDQIKLYGSHRYLLNQALRFNGSV